MITRLNRTGLRPVYDYCDTTEGCSVSQNPKAYDARRAIGFRQDSPSKTAGINETNIYTEPSLNDYHTGAPYGSKLVVDESGVVDNYATLTTFPSCSCAQNYHRLNNAQIAYYVDNTISMPFFKPVFDLPASVAYEDYVDPMGSWKPYYHRDIALSPSYSNLSYINDTAFYREDLMARQMAVRNSQRSEPFLCE